MKRDNKMTIQLVENIANPHETVQKTNGLKTEIPEKNYKANRTLRV